MSKEPESASRLTEESFLVELQVPITLRVVAVAMGGGLLGMVLMMPLLAGVPLALDLFRTESIVEFATFGTFLGLEPSLIVGVVLFVLGGTTVLPLLFLVAGAFLPPEEPRYARGVTFATVTWVGFVLAFWPGGGLTGALFVVISLVSHWIYGTTLGYVVHSTVGIPQHDV
ncbi:MAG: hypothetical protein QXG03_02680 [Halalkalicoccus sp.]